MELRIISPGKTRIRYLVEGIADFQKRITPFASCAIVYTKAADAGVKKPDGLVIEEEGRSLLAKIERPSWVVALDRQGKQIDSEGFAALITKWEGEAKRKICFLIGGHLGLSSQVVQQADTVLSFSAMTFTHEMARLLLLEQLYRAFCIRKGTGYHK